MKYFLLSILGIISHTIYAQFPTGGGTFPEYAQKNIKSITKIRIHYSDSLPNDTSFITKQFFNKKGQMIEEVYKCIYDTDCRYEYSYNDEGFLTRIDTNGFFGFGYGSSGSDTNYHTTTSTYRTFHKTTQLVNEIINYNDEKVTRVDTDYFYNSNGNLIKEVSITSNKAPYFIYVSSVVYLYNEAGLLIEKNYLDENEKLYIKELTIYEVAK